MCTHSTWNPFCDKCSKALQSLSPTDDYPVEWCGVCHDGCAELKRLSSFEFD